MNKLAAKHEKDKTSLVVKNSIAKPLDVKIQLTEVSDSKSKSSVDSVKAIQFNTT